jgi:deazaflavin-dependent oxidoreductase (nitroreductase family)
VALTYLEDGGRWIVVASNAGDDRDPTWWLNLAAHPRAQVMIGGRTVPVIAREVHGPEREALYRRFIDDIDRSYAQYQIQTTRKIAVVALQPEENA